MVSLSQSKKTHFSNFNDILAGRRPLIFSIIKIKNETHIQTQVRKP